MIQEKEEFGNEMVDQIPKRQTSKHRRKHSKKRKCSRVISRSIRGSIRNLGCFILG